MTINHDTSILVTGGTGFVGSYLLRQLLQQGYRRLKATKRHQSPMDLVASIADSVEWFEADILDIPALETAMEGVQIVFHCAAMISYETRDTKQLYRVNAEGTANIVNIALALGVEKLIHVSSISALGRLKDKNWYDEKFIWQNSPLNTGYSLSKFLAEQEVQRGIAEGLNAVIINPAVIIGAGYWDHTTCRFFRHTWNGNPFYPAGTTGFVDVRDVARFLVNLMESDITGERYIVSGENLRHRELLHLIAKGLVKRPPTIKANRIISSLAWRIQWLNARLFGIKPFITKQSARTSARHFQYDNSKSIRDFQFSYTPIAKTIEESCRLFLVSQEEGRKAETLIMY